ncbi:MAG: hypothetical protein QNK05_09500 [Myxococcota bacterium]|nr:hypothetical protein [Myxococcota bacterium]
MAEPGTWRRCSVCKEPIALHATYWVCNVSTCNRKRTALAFCSVNCWEVHLPGANHRESWAVEKTAPGVPHSVDTPAPAAPRSREPRRTLARPAAPPARSERSAPPDEILIIASRLKSYVRAKSGGFNTSDKALAPLSDLVRQICDQAIENARRDGRMTVLDRDVPKS